MCSVRSLHRLHHQVPDKTYSESSVALSVDVIRLQRSIIYYFASKITQPLLTLSNRAPANGPANLSELSIRIQGGPKKNCTRIYFHSGVNINKYVIKQWFYWYFK